jgi:hypothetical protein
VDEILFRRILGTVTNAIYFKPSIAYWLDLDSRERKRRRHLGLDHLQHRARARVHAGQLDELRRRAGSRAPLPQPAREHLRGSHLGHLLAHGRPQPPLWQCRQRPVEHAEDTSASQVIRTFVGIKF